MSVFAFILAWVLLTLGVILVAFSGGPKGLRERAQSQSRPGQRFATAAFVLALLIFGAAIPTAVTLGMEAREDIPSANVFAMTAQEKHGRVLFSKRCKNCHTLAAANAVAQVGPNLDILRPTKGLVLDAIKNGRARGNGQMAAGLFEGEDARDVAAFVAKAVGQTGQ